MAGVLQPITDLLTKLRTLTVTNGDNETVTPYVRIWNNQLAYDLEGQGNSFQKPAFFVEVLNDAVYENIGEYFRSADLSFRIHIIHEFYDAQDGTNEQDLVVFALRDKLVANLSGHRLTACGPLNPVVEVQDYEHKNLYHYIIDFVCNFTDSKGSKYDSDHPQHYIQRDPPVDLELDITTRTQTKEILFTVSQGKAYSTKYTASANGETVFLVLDDNGNMITGANIVSVTKEIKPLVPHNWTWNADTSMMTLRGGIELAANESAFIIYQQNV